MGPFEDVLKHSKQLTSSNLLCFQEFYPPRAPKTISAAITGNVWVEGRRKLNLSKEYRSEIGESGYTLQGLKSNRVLKEIEDFSKFARSPGANKGWAGS